MPCEDPPRAHGTLHSGIGDGYRPPRVIPQEPDLRRAAEVLNAGERVAMLVGQGALHAGREVVEVAELLGAGVAKALLGKAVLPDDLPWVTGSIGLLGTKPSWDMMMDCDTLLMVGSSFPYSEFLPEEGQARGVQIDIDGRMLGIRYPMEVNLVGDSAADPAGAAPAARAQGRPRPGRRRSSARSSDWWKLIETRAHNERRSDQSAARVLGAVAAPARPCDPDRRLGLVGELVRARRAHARGHDGLALGRLWPRWARACRTRSRRSSRTPTGR